MSVAFNDGPFIKHFASVPIYSRQVQHTRCNAQWVGTMTQYKVLCACKLWVALKYFKTNFMRLVCLKIKEKPSTS